MLLIVDSDFCTVALRHIQGSELSALADRRLAPIKHCHNLLLVCADANDTGWHPDLSQH